MLKVGLEEIGIDIRDISAGVLKVIARLEEKGYAAFIVGGAVRDLLFGLSPKDFDVATDARPEQIRRLFRRSRIIGRRFRIVHVRVGNQLIEVSTFRKAPSTTSGERKTMLKEDNTYGTIKEDAYRRDITINSLFLDPKRHCVYDYTGGLEDVRKKRVRVIGKPETRYREDPVRMLRIIRLASKLGCEIDPQSSKPIYKLRSLLDQVVKPRLFDEMIKIFFSHTSANTLLMLRKYGLNDFLFPHLNQFDRKQDLFWQTALNRADRITRKCKRISLSSVISSLFWPCISEQWCEYEKKLTKENIKMDKMREMYEASGVLENQILTKTMFIKIWEIWEFQVRLHNLKGKQRALRLVENYKLEKALAFLRLRNEMNEISDEFINWWEEFILADKKRKEEMTTSKK